MPRSEFGLGAAARDFRGAAGGTTVNVSVIIPTLNEAALIGHTLQRTWAAGAEEVIVVDGGSHDGTPELALQAGCVPLRSPPGRAEQQNAGARRARGEVLLFLHADTWLAADGVCQIKAALADPAVLGGAFRQRIEASRWAFRLLEWGNARRVLWFGLPYGDQGIFLRRDLFERLGGFPSVPLLEDLLLMRRFRHYGRPVLLPGPLHVSPRRWLRYGVVRQTLRSWSLLAAYALGVSPGRLARFYPRHDQS